MRGERSSQLSYRPEMAGGVGLEPTGAMRAALTVRCLAIRRTRQDEYGLGWQDRTADLLRPRQARYQAALIPEIWCPQSDSNGRLRAFNAALIQLSYRGISGTGARIRTSIGGFGDRRPAVERFAGSESSPPEVALAQRGCGSWMSRTHDTDMEVTAGIEPA